MGLKCKICGFSGEMKSFQAYEMMYGTRDEFEYFLCPECGCLQIKNIPMNLGDYYRKNYYSYEKRDGSMTTTKTTNTLRVLDVGCGSGEFLCKLAKEGYVNLCGCDPFLEQDIAYENGVKIYKSTIHNMKGEFDLIFFNDSFEHVTDPHEVMESVRRLLSSQGICRLEIPVVPNLAFDMFGVNWYQLDAPRHIFLHSKKSIAHLAENHGLKMIESVWDSDRTQIIRSFLYSKGIPLIQQTEEVAMQYFDLAKAKEIDETVKEINSKGYGDHALKCSPCQGHF